MGQTSKWIIAIMLFAAALVLAGFCLFDAGKNIGRKEAFEQFEPHTDTLYLPKDTIIYKPIYKDRWHVKTDTVRLSSVDTLYTTDSVLVEVPIEQKVYKDTSYTAWVSGFRPALDSIRITQPTMVINHYVKVEPSKWSWGVSVGPSMLYNGKVHVGMGATVGLMYNF